MLLSGACDRQHGLAAHPESGGLPPQNFEDQSGLVCWKPNLPAHHQLLHQNVDPFPADRGVVDDDHGMVAAGAEIVTIDSHVNWALLPCKQNGPCQLPFDRIEMDVEHLPKPLDLLVDEQPWDG